MVKNLPASARGVGSIPGWGDPRKGNGNPLQYFRLGNSRFSCPMACGILLAQGLKPHLLSRIGRESLNHWTTRKALVVAV